MRIVKNTSRYETKTLRSVLCKVHAHMRKLEGRPAPNWKNLRVKIGHLSRWGWSGYAYYGGKSWKDWDVHFSLGQGQTLHCFAKAVYHELMHTYGYRHSQYSDLPDRECEMLFPENGPLPEVA